MSSVRLSLVGPVTPVSLVSSDPSGVTLPDGIGLCGRTPEPTVRVPSFRAPPNRRLEGHGTVVRHSDLRRERLADVVGVFPEEGQRHDRPAERAPVGGRDQPLRVHERIEDPDERGALAGIVLEIEQVETVHLRRSERGLDLLAVEQRGEMAGGLDERLVLVQHSRLLKPTPKLGEIVRAQHARVLRRFGEVRVGVVLADLVAHERHASCPPTPSCRCGECRRSRR